MHTVCVDNIEAIIDSGYTKPISTITLAARESLIMCIKKHHCILKTKAELDQLKSGLRILGVGNAMEMYPKLMIELFVEGEAIPLTAGVILMH